MIVSHDNVVLNQLLNQNFISKDFDFFDTHREQKDKKEIKTMYVKNPIVKDEKPIVNVNLPMGIRDEGLKDLSVSSVNRVKKRGRPKGQKDRNARKRRTKEQIRDGVNIEDILLLSEVFTTETGKLEDGEVIEEVIVQLSVASALKDPVHGPNYRVAINKEQARILGVDTWGDPLTDEEIWKLKREGKQILPIAILLSRKRDGTYKCRAVVLGNLEASGNVEAFAGVVPSIANRYLLVEAVAKRDFMKLFDIDSAFLNAEVEGEYYVRIPPIWRGENDRGVRKLLKSLYGLRSAPRAWWKKYRKFLRSIGWEPCPDIEGLYRKPSASVPGEWLKMSVYVDDNILTGPNEEEVTREVEMILARFPGRIIGGKDSVVDEIEVKEYDILGADVFINREQSFLKISMATYIEKIAKKFDPDYSGKPVTTPNFEEKFLDEGEDATENFNGKLFPLREAVGALQWIATTSRPDVVVPLSVIARRTSKVLKKNVVSAVMKIIRYLVHTKGEGLTYSPGAERDFEQIYGGLLGEKISMFSDFPKRHLFSDSAFATCLLTAKSTSAAFLVYRGMGIGWKHSRQTLRSYSTAQSEYIAVSDAINFSEENCFTSFFDTPVNETREKERLQLEEDKDEGKETLKNKGEIIWCDNQAVLKIAALGDIDKSPRSRHFALKFFKVQENKEKLVFCPTKLMKADPLSKVSLPDFLRRLVLENIVAQGVDDIETVNFNLDFELGLWFKEEVTGFIVFDDEIIHVEMEESFSEGSD